MLTQNRRILKIGDGTRCLLPFFFVSLVGVLAGPLSETERVAEYDKRYERKWPPKEYVPNTEGWKNLMERRFRQIREIDDSGEKYEAYMQVS